MIKNENVTEEEHAKVSENLENFRVLMYQPTGRGAALTEIHLRICLVKLRVQMKAYLQKA